MKSQWSKKIVLAAVVFVFAGIGHLQAQCDDKLTDFIELDVEDIPVNVNSIVACVQQLSAEIKAQEAPAPKPKPAPKKPPKKKNDTLQGGEEMETDTAELKEEPVVKKMNPAQLQKKKELLVASYDQLIEYYQSGGVTDATQAKKYKQLKSKIDLKKSN